MNGSEATTLASKADTASLGDRRARRHQETVAEIVDIARMRSWPKRASTALSLAEVARRLGVQPPSLYKYFPSLMAVYDALFLRGQLEQPRVMRQAMAAAKPGLRRSDRGPRSQRPLGARQPAYASCCSGGRCRASSLRRGVRAQP